MTSDNYLPMLECQNNHLYSLEARNFNLGVYNSEHRAFVGVRQKFNQEYLFFELHWDVNPQFGTAKPLSLIEKCPFEIINWYENEKLFNWLKQKQIEVKI
jgi:hypothetical protein